MTYSGYAPLFLTTLVTMSAARARCPLDSPTRPQPCLCTLERTCSCGFPTSEIRAARDRDASLMHTNAHVRASVPSTTRTSQRLAQRCRASMPRRFGEGLVCTLRGCYQSASFKAKACRLTPVWTRLAYGSPTRRRSPERNPRDAPGQGQSEARETPLQWS